jgi:hypothetical protein
LSRYCTIRIAEPRPFGLTRFVAITRAIVAASFVKSPAGGKVEAVSARIFQRRVMRGYDCMRRAGLVRTWTAPRRLAVNSRPQPSVSTQSRGTR